MIVEQSRNQYFWDTQPSVHEQAKLNKQLALQYLKQKSLKPKLPDPDQRPPTQDQIRRRLVKEMGLTHDRAKIFKKINEQMYDFEPFRVNVDDKIPDSIIFQAEDLQGFPHR